MINTSSSVIALLRQILPLVPYKERRRFCLLLGLTVLMALSELALTSLVALLAAIFGSPEAVLNYSPILWIRERTGILFGNDPRLLSLATLCAILGTIAWKNILAIIQQRQMAFFSESVGAAARLHVFRFYQQAPFLWAVQNGVADLTFGLTAANHLANTLSLTLNIFTSILMLITLFTGLICVSPVPSLMFLCFLGGGGILIIRIVRKTMDRCARASYEVDYRTNKITHLALHGLKEMRLYCRENTLFDAYRSHMASIIAARTKFQTVARFPVCGLETLGFSTLVVMMLFLIFVQDAGMARISGIMGFMAAAAWRGLPVANRLMDAISNLRGGVPYLQKVTQLVALEHTLSDELLQLTETLPEPLPFTRDIVLEHVAFSYPEASSPAIQDVSMHIKAGTMLGLVGLSGAGKSTLVNLLTGLVPPDSGRILADGTPVTNDTARSWLRNIGYVAQAPYILDASLAENVALSRWGEAIDRDRVLECCRMAALDFLNDLEKGIDTVLGDRGTRLSGGQAQRVAIARALYSNPRLIIFDEATSALDMKNEKAIHETILSLRDSVTMVIIAHRLSTVEGCDAIVWLDKGRVRTIGKAEEVLPKYEAALRLSSLSQDKI